MHRDAPEMAGSAWGKDTMHAGGVTVTLHHAWKSWGLHTMSQQGLMSVMGHNTHPSLLPQ